MQVRLVFYIKLLAILHLCNAAPEEYDQIWDFHQIYSPPYPIFVTDATDDALSPYGNGNLRVGHK